MLCTSAETGTLIMPASPAALSTVMTVVHSSETLIGNSFDAGMSWSIRRSVFERSSGCWSSFEF